MALQSRCGGGGGGGEMMMVDGGGGGDDDECGDDDNDDAHDDDGGVMVVVETIMVSGNGVSAPIVVLTRNSICLAPALLTIGSCSGIVLLLGCSGPWAQAAPYTTEKRKRKW